MNHPYGRKRRTKEPLAESEKVGLKLNIPKTKIMPSRLTSFFISLHEFLYKHGEFFIYLFCFFFGVIIKLYLCKWLENSVKNFFKASLFINQINRNIEF